MTPQQHQRVSEVFSAVIALEPSQRTAMLDQSCGNDPFLRDSVETLLRYHARPANLLDDPSFWKNHAPDALNELRRRPSSAPPPRIGRYSILGVLGEGGMGVVYLAEQDKPKRTVALKVIRRAGASAELLRRFEFEQEALGRLQHPGIAQIFAADISEDGQPFFAMEYIIGVPLTEYADAHELDVAQRLELLAQICDAVQHAHQRGVIHRDLKPRNILITQSGQPKILDFGVARAARSDGQAASQATDSRHVVGTLAYMSPEQFNSDAAGVDARSDVYSLGVMLYELLTGQLPHDFQGAALHEAARIAHDVDPPAPGEIERSLRGDVETIIIKALEKDSERRYRSAAQLADDIRRYLAGQPIIARQDSALYVLRKRLRRYRWAAAASVVFVVFLSLFAAYAMWRSGVEHVLTLQERQARQEALGAQREADLQRDDAQKARDSEYHNRKIAEANASRAQAVTAFLVETLGLADPDVTQDPEMKVDDLLDQAAEQVGTALAQQPEAEAVIRTAIGKAYASQGELESADVHFRRALEIRRRVSPQDFEGLYEILWPYWRVLSDLDDIKAAAQRSEAIRIGQKIIRASDPELGNAIELFMAEIKSNFDAKKADPLFDRTVELSQQLQPDDPLLTYIADQWHAAGTGIEVRDPAAASRYLSASLDVMRGRVPETNTRIVRTLEWLVRSKISAGEHVEAERMVRESLQLLSKVLPDDHWYVAVHHAWLGEALIGQGRYEQAESLLLQSHARLVKGRGLASGYTITVLMDLVKLYDAWERPADADHRRDELARAVAGSVTTANMPRLELLLSKSHPKLLKALYDMRTPAPRGKIAMAIVEQEERLRHESIPDDHPYAACIADALEVWAKRNQDNGGTVEISDRIWSECYAINQAGHLRHPRKQADALWYLATSALEHDELAEAERLARQGIDVLNSGPPERYGYTAVFEGLLGDCLMQQGRNDEARPWLEHGFETLRIQDGPGDSNTLVAAWRMVDLNIQLGQLDQAEHFAVIAAQSAMLNEADGVYMNRAAWRIARVAGFSPQAYQTALDSVSSALKLEPGNANWLDTLGAVQYRTGQFDAALATLTRADQINKGAMAEDAAFLCLTCLALGKRQAAEEWNSRFHQLALKPPNEFKQLQWQMLAHEMDAALKPSAR